jgi:hypothetical protein
MLIDTHYVTHRSHKDAPLMFIGDVVAYATTPNQEIVDYHLSQWGMVWFPKEVPNSSCETPSLRERFTEQADKWERETGHLSSPAKRSTHPSYQAILGMGEPVIPLLLADLKSTHRPWFGALSFLTKDNPVKREDLGRVDRMVAAWIEWGKSRGLI